MKGDSTRRQLDLGDRYAAARGWTIDRKTRDTGVSAFRGKNADADNALGRILNLVRFKRIPAGSVLLVESLDRLTRQTIPLALELFLGLLREGITVVTLGGSQPVEYTQGSLDTTSLILSIVELGRAHGESAWKSSRLSEAWKNKRANIKDKPLTGLVPAWCRLTCGKIVTIPERVAVVKDIFRLVTEGKGITAIVKRLNARETPTIGRRSSSWQRSYVAKILHSRAVLGEYQPCTVQYVDGRKKRIPSGDPVPNYFPAIIGEDEFYSVQKLLASRKTHTGPTEKFTNIFKGLLQHIYEACPLQVANKGTGRAYVSSAAISGIKGTKYVAFPVVAFEAAFFKVVVNDNDLELKDDRAAQLTVDLNAAEGRFATVSKKLASITDALTTDDDADAGALVPIIKKLSGEKKELTTKISDIRQHLAAAKMDGPAESREALASRLGEIEYGYAGGQLPNDERHEVGVLIRQLVARIDCAFGRKGNNVGGEVVVTFVTGQRMTYTISVHSRRPFEVAVNDEVCGTGIEPKETAAISDDTKATIQRAWAAAKRPAEIAATTGVSVSQVYRLCKGIKRVGKWKPANRWDGHSVTQKRPAKN